MNVALVKDSFDELIEITSVENWDDDHGRVIDISQWKMAAEFYEKLIDFGFPKPFVSPCGDGYIHFSWTKENGDRAVFEFNKLSKFYTILPNNMIYSINTIEDLINNLKPFFK